MNYYSVEIFNSESSCNSFGKSGSLPALVSYIFAAPYIVSTNCGGNPRLHAAYGNVVDEVGREKSTGKILVKIDEKYFRPCEVEFLLGHATKAETELGWTREYDLDRLIDDMMK